MLAVGSLMVMENVVESEPPELFAQTVKVVVVKLTVGVPCIAPKEFIDRPLGRAGDISQPATIPPLLEMDIGTMDTLRVSVALLTEDVMLGASSLMVMLMLAKSEPPELFAQMV